LTDTPFAELLRRAAEVRDGLCLEGTDAWRLLDGMYEGAPGWTVDRYGGAVLVQSFAPGGCEAGALDELVVALRASLGDDVAIWLKDRGHRDRGQRGGRHICGPDADPHPVDPLSDRAGRLVVQEAGLRFGVDLSHGQNTGLFLDARPARQRVRALAEGRRILNLFSYTSAFGLAAAAGGARSITNVDQVAGVLERGRANFLLNGLEADPRSHLRSEVFEFLRHAKRRGETWDGVVVDPPPYPMRTGRGRKRGWDPARDLGRLLERCAGRLAEGGWLLAISAARGRKPFEERLPKGAWEPVERGADFPGPREQGMRGWLLGAG
jgi:23S rRNA (cytosine1962-C5)-methyltransferase